MYGHSVLFLQLSCNAKIKIKYKKCNIETKRHIIRMKATIISDWGIRDSHRTVAFKLGFDGLVEFLKWTKGD